jgi:hypothetical protein
MPKYQHAKPFDFVRDFKNLQNNVKALQIRASGPSPQPNQLVTLASGFTGYPVLSDTDSTVYTNANNGTQPMTLQWTIPANDASVDTSYEVWVPLALTTGTTVSVLGFKPYFNGALLGTSPNYGTSNGDQIGSTAMAISTIYTAKVRLTVVITGAGSGGAANFYIEGKVSLSGNLQGTVDAWALSSQATGVAFDTTAVNTVAVASVWNTAESGQTINSLVNTLTRKGP